MADGAAGNGARVGTGEYAGFYAPPYTRDRIAELCAEGKIPGAVKIRGAGQGFWLIPRDARITGVNPWPGRPRRYVGPKEPKRSGGAELIALGAGAL